MVDNRLIQNAVMGALQVFFSGAILFLLFHYLLKEIGPDKVGIWSIILASASVAKISEMGFSGSAVKFVAKYLARDEKNNASHVIQTTVITIGLVLATVFVSSYSVIIWLLSLIISGESLALAISLLPYALISMWIGAIAGVFLSGLDGCQRIKLRAFVSIIGSLIFLLAVWLLVPIYGLFGLAWAQVVQGAFTLLLGWMLLKRDLPSLPLVMYKWHYQVFCEMLSYGVGFQTISIFSILIDPVTKGFLAKFGGLSSVAFYEMANRMVTQFRLLLVAANQVIVPKIAELCENAPEKIGNIYESAYRIIFFLSLPFFSLIVAMAPLISEIWIGQFEAQFVFYVALLSLAYWINTLTVPAYFVFLGTGKMRWNIISAIGMAIINVFLGYLLGQDYGWGGVAVGYAIASIYSSLIIIYGYCRENNILFSNLLPAESKKLFIFLILGLLVGWAAFFFLKQSLHINIALWMPLLFVVIIVPVVVFQHPLSVKIILILQSFLKH